jgi:F0F1-type ATP synthase assembly protein I
MLNNISGMYVPENDEIIIKNVEIENKKNNELINIEGEKFNENLKNYTYYNISNNNNSKIDDDEENDTKDKIEVYTKILFGVVLGAVIGYFIAPIMIFIGLTLLGFTIFGVLFGSIAAWIMSLYGGSIAAGSIVSILQSMGALGFLNLFGGGCGIIIVEYIIFKF